MPESEQPAAPTPEDTIDIGDDNNKNEEDKEDDNTLYHWTARKQGCENDSEKESIFSKDSEDDHDDNNPNENYSESTDDEIKKNKSKRKTPKSTIMMPRKTHWTGRTSPAAQEEATVLVSFVADPNVAKFMVSDGLDEITKIQQLTSATILLYAKNSRKNMSRSDIVSTRFILDLEKSRVQNDIHQESYLPRHKPRRH